MTSGPRAHRLRAWLDSSWPLVPSQAVLFLFIWIASIHVAVTQTNARIGFDDIGFAPGVYAAWNVLMLLAPPMVAMSWLLLRFRRGRYRVVGLWLRLGGDIGVFMGLLAFLVTRMALLRDGTPGRCLVDIGDSPLFALVVLSGIEGLVGLYVLRDSGSLVLMESWASHVRSVEKAASQG